MEWFKNIIEKISLKFVFNRKNSPNIKNVQNAKGNIVNVGNQIVLYSAEEIAGKLLNSAFGELSEATKDEIRNNQQTYFNILAGNLKNVLLAQEELKKIVDSPDFQYVSKKAAISASRSNSIELHNSLSLLLVDRINSNGSDLKRIVYNEAISTVEKLTPNQLKILALCFLTKRTKLGGLKTIQQFAMYLDQRIRPFINYKNTSAEFEHLVYTGCASISIASHDIAGLFQENYKDIFDAQNSDVRKSLENNETAKELFDIWGKSQIANINLTSVGIVIGSSYYEQTTGDKINIDIWIN